MTRITRAVAPGFAPALDGHDLDRLDAMRNSVVGVTDDLRIAYWNRGWVRFALENDGADVIARWPLGASIAPVLPDVLQPAFAAALAGSTPGALGPRMRYHCSSPTVERQLELIVHRLDGGYLLVHACAHEGPVPWAPSAEPVEAYRGANGFIVQCASCRWLRRPSGPPQWDWVPAAVGQQVRDVSHGLCQPCSGTLYPLGGPE